MKLDEFKKIEEEFRFSDLLGTDYASKLNPKDYEVKPRLSKDAFIKDFIEDAMASLDSGIKGGLIDPNPQVPAIGSKVQPNEPKAATTPPTQPKAATTPPTQPKAATTPPTQQPSYQATAAKYNLPTNKFNENYIKLNKIFENIIQEQTGGASSIGDYLKTRWYPSYMKGVNYSQAKQVIDKTIDQIQMTYKKDKGMAALTSLANLSFTLSKDNIPAGANDVEKETEKIQPAVQQTSPQIDSNQITTSVLKNLTDLQKTDPAAFIKLLNDIQKLKQSAFTSRPEGTLGVSTPAAQKQVAESKNIKKSSKK